MSAVEDLKEQNLTARELCVKIDSGMDNPMLIRIAEAAPSPKAADRYVTGILGWPNAVGQMARNMTRLRQKVDAAAWKVFKATSLRASKALFGFDEATKLWGLEAEAAMMWGAGQVALRGHWPLFLREFRLPESSSEATTYDGAGECTEVDIPNLDLDGLYFKRDGLQHYAKLRGVEDLTIRVVVNRGESTCWFIGGSNSFDNSFVIEGGSLVLSPNPPDRPFPQFYKVLRIHKESPGEVDGWRGVTREEITVLVRRDFFKHSQEPRGTMRYRRIVELKSGPMIFLDVNFLVSDDFGLLLDTVNPASIFSLPGDRVLFTGEISPSHIATGFQHLAGVLWSIRYPRPLAEIAGRELIGQSRTPRTLAQLIGGVEKE